MAVAQLDLGKITPFRASSLKQFESTGLICMTVPPSVSHFIISPRNMKEASS
jgi:hypothetical protein